MTIIIGIRGSGAIHLTHGIHGGGILLMLVITRITHLIITGAIMAVIMADITEHIMEEANIIGPGIEADIR